MKKRRSVIFLISSFLVLMFLFVFAMGFSLFFWCVHHEKSMANVGIYAHVKTI
jgi:hypothetical protein